MKKGGRTQQREEAGERNLFYRQQYTVRQVRLEGKEDKEKFVRKTYKKPAGVFLVCLVSSSSISFSVAVPFLV